jgi:hypothetical protein
MRNLHKYGMMVAAAALMTAAGSVAQAADPDLQSLQQQILQLQQQLQQLQANQAKQAAAPAAAAATPTKSPYDISMTDPSRGAFVIPGTNTTLHVGGFIDLSASYDANSSIGPAGYIQTGFSPNKYANNAAGNATGNSSVALPGTPFAKAIGRFQMDPRFSRLNMETDTPSEFGDIGTVLEFDLFGEGLSANQKLTYSTSPRLRRAFVTVGNWLFGQTQQLTYDGATNVGSIDNNSFMGQESGNRWPQIQYRWNIDPAQKHQAYFAVEAPYSDVLGIAPSNFTAGNMNYQSDVVSHVPDFSAKYVENGTWGRFFAAGTLRNIEVNTNGVPGSTAFSGNAAGADVNPIHTNIWSGYVDAGAKVYTTLGDRRNAVFANANWGPADGRGYQYNQNNSAVLSNTGKLYTQQAAGFNVAYQHWFNDNWQSNLAYGLQHQWNKLAYQNPQGLWKGGQQVEANVLWMPTSFLNFGLAYQWLGQEAVAGQCEGTAAWSITGGATCTGTPAVGATRLISGTSAYDNRVLFRTRVNF